MLRILLELHRFSDFLSVPAICILLVCPQSKYVFVLYSNSMLNNENGPVLLEIALFVPWVSSADGESEAHPLFRNPIQNP
jgi:hypothetical protein